MRNLFNVIVDNLKKNKNLVVFSIAVFILGVILGAVLTIGDDLECLYKERLSNYLVKVFSKECSPFKLLFERLVNCVLVLLLVSLLSLNKYTFFINFLVLFYRAFILGLAGKIFITGALVSGLLTFILLIFVQAVFLCFAIVVYISLIYNNYDCSFNKLLKLTGKIYLICLIIAIVGGILELLIILLMFRPISVYF